MSVAGGFVYKSIVIGPWSDVENTQAKQALELMRIVDLFTSSGQGWTAPSTPTPYGTKAHFIVLTNTTGAKVCIGFGGNNDKPTTSLTSSFYSNNKNFIDGFWFSYLPPSLTSPGFGSSLSNIDTFLPIEATPVFCGTITTYASGSGSFEGKINKLSFGFKNDVFWMAYKSINTSAISFQHFCVAGKIIDVIENQGSNLFSRYAISGDCVDAYSNFKPISQPETKSCFYREIDGVGSSRAITFGSKGSRSRCYNCLIGSKLHSDVSSVRWGHVVLHLESTNLPVDGVANGDGVRGSIDPNIMKCCPETALTEGQLLDGGDMIHLFNGVCVGWDADNDPYEA